MIGLFRSPGIVYLQTVARDSLVQRLTAVSSLIRSSCSKLVMARNRRPCKPNQKMPVRKGRQERCQYRLGLKATVVHWKTVDKLTPQQIRMKVIPELGHDVPLSTLSTWWSDKTLEKGCADHRAPDHDAVVTQICCMIDSLDVGHCPRSNI